MLVLLGLCQTCSETTLLGFSHDVAFIMVFIPQMAGHDVHDLSMTYLQSSDLDLLTEF